MIEKVGETFRIKKDVLPVVYASCVHMLNDQGDEVNASEFISLPSADFTRCSLRWLDFKLAKLNEQELELASVGERSEMMHLLHDKFGDEDWELIHELMDLMFDGINLNLGAE